MILSVVYSLNNQKDSVLHKNLCYLNAASCVIEIADTQLQVSFSAFPIEVEEMLDITLTYDPHFVAKQGWLEGTNMYMGKTPLLFKDSRIEDTKNNVVVDTELFIGACSEPDMRWKLHLELEDIQTGKIETVSVFFQTQVN